MRKISLFILMGILVLTPAVFAKPEQIRVKSRQEESVHEKSANAGLKNLELSRIQDPEARKAIREIVAYLNSTARK